MKRLFMLLSGIALLAAGCSDDYDDSSVWKELNDQATRIAALETWQAQANSNIGALQGLVTALEARDNVTDVKPITEGGVTVGYTISFTKSPSITILNGKDGKSGADGSTPEIGIKKDTDGLYYWTLNGEWLLDGDKNKVPTSGAGIEGEPGADGKTPKIRINTTTKEWEISADGSEEGYITTGISATGPQGDAIFALNGVDYLTNDAYVEFTLADGMTKIKVPKYRKMAIEFTAPTDSFAAGETKTIDYTSTGTELPSSITVASIPEGWSVTVTPNATGGQIKITAPTDLKLHNAKAEVSFLLADSENRLWLHGDKLTCGVTGLQGNQIGAYYFENGDVIGIVWREYNPTPHIPEDKHGLILHKDRLNTTLICYNYEETVFELSDEHDGWANYQEVITKIPLPGWQPTAWRDLSSTYGEGWYIPAKNELVCPYDALDVDDLSSVYWTRMGIINSALNSLGLSQIKENDQCFVSTGFDMHNKGYNYAGRVYMYKPAGVVIDDGGDLFPIYYGWDNYGGFSSKISVHQEITSLIMRAFEVDGSGNIVMIH